LDQQEGFQSPGYSYTRKVDNSHGRMEIRECWAISEENYLAYVGDRQNWKNLSTLAMIRSERRFNDKVEIKTRYFISSAVMNARTLLRAKRSHWGIDTPLEFVDCADQQTENLSPGLLHGQCLPERHRYLTLWVQPTDVDYD